MPLEVAALVGLIERILATGTELRFAPSLHPLRNAILKERPHFRAFGIHRFEFAAKAEGEG
ncbi:hypothetical protein SD70_20045 [Gordoniibacillus kamchatkensis]|uniref:Uncharacterized protein n=1 Tax=Gordoniibacillus kamchatkensis TaxID=1590651 RepID=A0ABR5AFX4_9BACL|nr:hypothetical protein [Paenibacillus sp. VKM B-2647]KIL39460.1 hypothetical protein SD70_20045 [Paenibacillus sp. VKM B-2647]